MIIDIKPVIIKANQFERTCMEMREIDALYQFNLSNGEQYSVQFDDYSLTNFLPNKKVSETLISWEETLQRRYDEAVKTVKTGIHPTWETTTREYYPNTEIWTGRMIPAPYKLTKDEIKSWEKLSEDIKKKLGKLTFIKIIVE